MAETIVTLSANDAALMKALQRIVGEQNKVDAGFAKVKKSSADASNAFKPQHLDSIVTGVGKVAAGWAGVEVVASTVNARFAEMVEKQERSLSLSLDIAAAQAVASKNFTGLTPEEKAAAFEAANQISAKTGFSDKAKINEAMSSGMGVISDVPTVANAVSAAAPLSLHNPDELKDLARGALAVQRATGVTSPEANLGFLQSAAGNAFIESNALVASRMTPVLGSSLREVPNQDAKDAAIDVAATFGELSKLLSDATGDISKTNADKFFLELDKVFDAGQFPDPGTLRGRISAAQTNPEVREQVLKGFGENEGTGAIKQLLDGTSTAAKSFENSIKTISFDPRTYAAEVKDQQSLTPQIAIATAMKKSESRDTSFAESDDQSTVAAVRKIVDDTLAQANARGIAGMFDSAVRTTFGSGIGPAPTGDSSIGGMVASVPRAVYNLASQGGPKTGNEAIQAGIERLEGQIAFLNDTSLFGLSKSDEAKIAELEKSIAVLNDLQLNLATALANRDAGQKLNPVVPTSPPTLPVVTGPKSGESPRPTEPAPATKIDAYPSRAAEDMARQEQLLREIRDSLKKPSNPNAPQDRRRVPSLEQVREQANRGVRP